MVFQRGNKLGGRKVGAIGQKTIQWQIFSDYMLGAGLERFQRELETLKGKDYTDAVTHLMEFFKPKLARTEQVGEEGGPIKHSLTIEFVDTNTKKV